MVIFSPRNDLKNNRNLKLIDFRVFYGVFCKKSSKKWSKGTKFGYLGGPKWVIFVSNPKFKNLVTSLPSFLTHKYVGNVFLSCLGVETGFQVPGSFGPKGDQIWLP